MAEKEELKPPLRAGAVRVGKRVSETQLNEAVELLANRRDISRDDLRLIGKTVAGDDTVFANTDIDDINTVLDQLDD
jgi:hypothetical protein